MDLYKDKCWNAVNELAALQAKHNLKKMKHTTAKN